MRVNQRLSRAVSAVTAAVLALAVLAVAQTSSDSRLSTIRIKNFGKVDNNLYRGAQPKRRDYTDLAALGVKTVIDLQQDGESGEQDDVEAAGMKFYRIGLSDSSWPSPDKAAQFLKLVNDPVNQPVFIHCHGGRHRAGTMTALYRITHDNWSADQAYAEMKRYDFESGFGHGTLKDYVYDYAQKNQKSIVVNTNTNK
jgi:protein tyrosine/serine phosphatase